MPQKLTTTACFTQEKSSGGRMKQAVVLSF